MKRYIRSARSSNAYVPGKRGSSKSRRGSSKSRTQRNTAEYDGQMYDSYQMEEIQKGLESGVDVNIYADPEYTGRQMEEIRLGLENGVDVSMYADPKYGEGQMMQIREGLENGVDVSVYADPGYNGEQMMQIRLGLEKYANDPDIHTATAEQIIDAYERNAPTIAYASMSKYDKAKNRWSKVKQSAQSGLSVDVPALEDEFNLMPLEGRAASTLGISFNENADGSVTFVSNAGEDLGTISADRYDQLVCNAIANSSTRSSFAKAFATQLKRVLNV